MLRRVCNTTRVILQNIQPGFLQGTGHPHSLSFQATENAIFAVYQILVKIYTCGAPLQSTTATIFSAPIDPVYTVDIKNTTPCQHRGEKKQYCVFCSVAVNVTVTQRTLHSQKRAHGSSNTNLMHSVCCFIDLSEWFTLRTVFYFFLFRN
jgi:hypothetical protein